MPAERRELERAADWIAELGAEAQLPAWLIFRLELCLGEALTNIVDHGFDAGKSGEIAVRFRADSEGLELVVDDDGRPFDPLSLPARRSPQRLEDAEPGGLGVPLIRRFTDSCRYERRADRNQLTLSWRRRGDATDSGEAG